MFLRHAVEHVTEGVADKGLEDSGCWLCQTALLSIHSDL